MTRLADWLATHRHTALAIVATLVLVLVGIVAVTSHRATHGSAGTHETLTGQPGLSTSTRSLGAAAATQPDRTRQLRNDVYATVGAAHRSAANQALAAARQGRPNTSALPTPAPQQSRHDGWRSPHHHHLSSGPELEL